MRGSRPRGLGLLGRFENKKAARRQKAGPLSMVEELEGRRLMSTTTFLSDMPWASASGGYGPVERDMSNGGRSSRDGAPIQLNGVTYRKGLGTHSASTIVYNLGGKYDTFAGHVGIDDGVGSRGSAVFQVFADGRRLYDSGLMTGASPTKRMGLNVSGVKQLTLVVRDGGNGIAYDHADWAGARLISSDSVTPPPVGSTPTAYSGPIVITRGGTYSGNWESQNPYVPAVQIRTSEPVVIQNANIRSRSTLIASYGYAANITVRNTRGYGLNPNVARRYPGRFLDVDGFVNVRLENNYMEGTSGVYLHGYRGNRTANQTVKVLRNSAKNIDGRFSDGRGGFLTGPDDNYLVQFFQIDGVKSLVGAEVAWNQVINEPYKSFVEDNISIHNTTGTASSPFMIHDNYIKGGYPANAAGGGYSGGGIMVSDNGSAYIRAFNNQVVSTSNYGIAISSGHDNGFYNNRIVSSGLLPDGRRIASQNVGAYIWNEDAPAPFSNNWGRDNVIGWAQGSGRNDYWTPDASSWTNPIALPNPVTLATEANEWTIWQGKLGRSAVRVGVA